jgi:hypothetical protein
MPYHRHTVALTKTFAIEQIALLEPNECWEPEHEPTVLKLVVPLSGFVYTRTFDSEDLLDAASVLTMVPTSPYRLRQPVSQASVVISIKDETIAEEFCSKQAHTECRLVDPRTIANVHRTIFTLPNVTRNMKMTR